MSAYLELATFGQLSGRKAHLHLVIEFLHFRAQQQLLVSYHYWLGGYDDHGRHAGRCTLFVR